jgi:hypothetical protein
MCVRGMHMNPHPALRATLSRFAGEGFYEVGPPS